jgi:hypothetical protein
MKQEATLQEASHQIQGKEEGHDGSRLGPLLCWAVVFADVGTSIYYVPGILYGNVGNLAGFFVMLTMSVFVLLTLKFEYHDPYYDDQQARKTFGKAEHLAQKAKIARRFVYRQQEPEAIERIWQVVHPRDLVISPENTSLVEQINPDRIRYEVTPDDSIVHLLKSR